jgi:hypothetical protein
MNKLIKFGSLEISKARVNSLVFFILTAVIKNNRH